MGSGASKPPKNVKVVQEASPEQQEGQLYGRDVQSRHQGQSNQPDQPGILTQSGQPGIPTQSGQTGILTQPGQTGIPTQPGQIAIPSQSQQQRGVEQQPIYTMQGGGKQPIYTMQGGGQQPIYTMQGGGQQPFNPVRGGRQQPFNPMQTGEKQPFNTMQGGGQQQFNTMQGGGQQQFNTMQVGGQQPIYTMQGVGQQPFNPMQGVEQQPFNPMQRVQQQPIYTMQGGGQQPFNTMQGGGQKPLNTMQGGGQQPFNTMQGGGQQPFNTMQGGGQQQFNPMQGGGKQPFNTMQGGGQQQFNPVHGGGQQPFNTMQGGGQQPFNTMQGGEQQPFNTMQGGGQQPIYTMQGGGQQPIYAMQGGGQQPTYTMQGGGQQPFNTMQGGQQQPFNPVHGGGQQPFNTMQGGGQQPFNTMQCGGQQPFHTMQGGGQQPFNTMQGGGNQPFNTMQCDGQQPFNPVQGGGQQPFNPMQGGQQPFDVEQQPFSAIQGGRPQTCREVQGREQLPSQSMQRDEKQLYQEGRQPNKDIPETDKAQEASKLAQSQTKTCHTIHLAVDPDVMEYVLTSSHKDAFQNIMKARQIEIHWKLGKNSAVITYNGEKSESWKTECIEAVQSFLNTFEKDYLPVQKEVWKKVQEQLLNSSLTLAKDSLLLKSVQGQCTLTIVASRTIIEHHKERLNTQIKNMYKEAMFQKKKIANISKSHMSLIKFHEHLREKCPEVEVVFDEEKNEIRLEGPRDQLSIVVQDLLDQKQAATKKQLTLDSDSFEILATEEGKAAIDKTLRDEDIEAVHAFIAGQGSVEVLGSSDEHAKKAAAVISGIVTKQKLRLNKNHLSLMADECWSKKCKEVQEKKHVLIRKPADDVWVVGLKSNVTKAVQKLQFYLDHNAESEEEIEFRSIDVKGYLLRCIKSKQEEYNVKVRDGEDNLSFYISGRDEGLKKALDMIDKLSKDVVVTNKVFKLPGLETFLKTDDFDERIKKVGEEENCFIRVEKNLGSVGTTLYSHSAGVTAVSGSSGLVTSSGANALVTAHGHKISWKTGDITNEQADILVIPQGACFNAIKSSFNHDTIKAATQLKVGDTAVSSGSINLQCSHVIHCCCSFWNTNGEKTLRTIVQNCLQKGDKLGKTSIAFPVIGTGILRFPPQEASRIMLDEAIKSCEKLQHSTLKDIRFVLYHKDKDLVDAFQQEVMKIQNQGTKIDQSTAGIGMDEVEIEIAQGNLVQETSDAIVNVIGTDLNMNNFGQLSKVIAEASGPQVQQECNQKGPQTPGSAVITSGGNLAAKRIIHIVTGSSDKQHLQTCLEAGLRLADANNLQSISIPAIGTGGYGLSATESAQLTFQALKNIRGNFQSISKVRIVIFQAQMVQAFQQEQQKGSLPPITAVPSRAMSGSRIKVDVIKGDLTRETTDAIVNVIGTDLNMNNFGQLSKVIAQASGPQVQQECNQKGPQTPGSAVMTSGGNLAAKRIIHIVTGSADKQHLQSCLEAGLRLADRNNLQSISIPAIGTGGFGLSATVSANVVFQALKNFSQSCVNISQVRIVVFHGDMIQAFQQQKNQWDPGAPRDSSRLTSQSSNLSVIVWVTGGSRAIAEKAIDDLKKIFSKACDTKKVNKEGIASLSDMQINHLIREAYKCDMEITVDKTVKSITVRGYSADIPDMVSKIMDEINKGIEKEKQKQEDENAEMVSKVVEWSYTERGRKQLFDKKTNAQLELAHSKTESTAKVSINRKEFTIDLQAKTGCCQRNGEQITVTRTPKEGNQEIPLPDIWTSMPINETVIKVSLHPSSIEYQDVLQIFQATAQVNVKNIERVQNPGLYRSYIVKKQAVDKANGGNNERKLFHGTDGNNISQINAQGFNRSYCGKNGTAYGRGVYFARDASYSLGYTGGGGGGGYMYLARVLVGQYCQGNSSMITPPPKNRRRPDILFDSVVDNPQNPAIFVVFFDNLCYPEYIITL